MCEHTYEERDDDSVQKCAIRKTLDALIRLAQTLNENVLVMVAATGGLDSLHHLYKTFDQVKRKQLAQHQLSYLYDSLSSIAEESHLGLELVRAVLRMARGEQDGGSQDVSRN